MTDSAAIAELIARARRVKKETADSANTAFRVGSLIEDLINALSSGAEIDLDKIRAEIEALEAKIPTLTSQLTNDSRFVTEDKLEDYLLKKDHIPYDDIIALFT